MNLTLLFAALALHVSSVPAQAQTEAQARAALPILLQANAQVKEATSAISQGDKATACSHLNRARLLYLDAFKKAPIDGIATQMMNAESAMNRTGCTMSAN